MAEYADPGYVRVDQLKPNDLVRVNDFAGTRKELDLWANVLEVARWRQDPGTRVSIHLGGGYQFLAEPDREYCCRVAIGDQV